MKRAGEHRLVKEPVVARALQLTLFASTAASLAIAGFTYVLGWPLIPLLSLLSALSGVVALLLSRSGWIRSAILFALLGIGYTVMHAAAVNDGMQSIGLAAIPVLIVIGSLLLDSLMLAVFTGTAALATAAMLGIRYYVLKLEAYSTNDLGDFFIFLTTCVVAAVVGRLFAVRIQEGFQLVSASERRYRRIFDNIQDVYYEMLPDGTMLELSPAAPALFGVSRETLLGRSFASCCVNLPEFGDLVAALRREGRVSNREIDIRGAGGAPVRLLVNAILQSGPEPGEERIVGSIRDITGWRQAEEALRESEARLRLALEATGAGTFDFYPVSAKLIWSDMTRRQFDIPAGTEVDYAMFLDRVHPEDRDRIHEAERAAADPANDGRLAVEFRIFAPEDGRVRWLAVSGRMMFDAEHRATRLIGTSLDISERKHLEEELRRRVEELRKIMDVAPVGLFTAHDPECSVVTLNRTGFEMLGMEVDPGTSPPQGRIPPCPFYRNGIEIPVDDLPLQQAAAGIDVRDCELEVQLQDGTRRLLWGHATPLRDAAGQVRGAIAAFQDVTDSRLRTDALLRESEERFRRAADAAPVILWFGDTEKRLTFVNEEMLRFTGLPAEQLLGHAWMQVLHPDDLEGARDTYYEGVENRASYQLEYRARRADGEYRHLLGTTNPRYVGKEYVGQVGSAIDITDLKRRQKEYLASQKLESIGKLAGGIAHDFNNLLGSVLAQSELALAELEDGESPVEELRRIGEVAKRGSEIVRQLMIYAGKENAASAACDLSATVRGMLELIGISVSKRIALTTSFAPDLPSVRAASAQVQQIILNLVTNASEAIGSGDGAIHVVTGSTTVGPDTFDGHGNRVRAGEYLLLEVSDTGCGISQAIETKIFDPFFSTKSDGRGLGLSVVQGIVRGLDGTIEIASQPGKGATFRVRLPRIETAAPDTPRPGEADAAPSSARAENARVLIVEDEQPFREPVARLLARQGFSVIEAADGTAAIEMLRSQTSALDIVLLDITLPGASSREVFEEVKRLMPHARIIATSAYSADAAAAALQDQVAYFIRKPYRFADLAALIRKALA